LNTWPFLTRFGGAEVLLPMALLAILALCMQTDGRPMAARWGCALVLAVLVTAVSKILFMGWGLGSAALNFTGVSGHTLLASAVYPVVLPLFGSPAVPRSRKMLLALGCLLALLIGVSRLVLHAHSPSEVLAGWVLGGGVAVFVHRQHAASGFSHRPVVAGVFVACIALVLQGVDHSPSHALITRLALRLSGQPEAHSRAAMLAQSALVRPHRLLQP
jgi:membrane-associated phospholipid phosphatase